jgi:malate dehydrogenase
MTTMTKIAIIGAGFVGSTVAYVLCLRKIVDEIALIDIKPGLAEGKALDISQSISAFGQPVTVQGSTDFSLMKGASIVVITAGVPRQPHQRREDTLHINAKIMRDVITEVKRYAPKSILIVISNPLDAMTWLAAKESGFEKQRVFGMAGTLDTARYKAFVAERLKVSPASVEAVVLGGHGDLMVPLSRLATVNDKPLQSLLAEKELRKIELRTRHGGAEIVNMMGQSAYYAPGAAVYEVVEALVKGSRKPVPVSAWLEGEYGLTGLFLGVPCRLGKDGVEKVVELPLNKEELDALHESARHVTSLIAELKE